MSPNSGSAGAIGTASKDETVDPVFGAMCAVRVANLCCAVEAGTVDDVFELSMVNDDGGMMG